MTLKQQDNALGADSPLDTMYFFKMAQIHMYEFTLTWVTMIPNDKQWFITVIKQLVGGVGEVNSAMSNTCQQIIKQQSNNNFVVLPLLIERFSSVQTQLYSRKTTRTSLNRSCSKTIHRSILELTMFLWNCLHKYCVCFQWVFVSMFRWKYSFHTNQISKLIRFNYSVTFLLIEFENAVLLGTGL